MTSSIRPASWLTDGAGSEFWVWDTAGEICSRQQHKSVGGAHARAMYQLRVLPPTPCVFGKMRCVVGNVSPARCVARSDLRNLGLLSVDLLIVPFIRAARLRTLVKFMMQGILFVPNRVL